MPKLKLIKPSKVYFDQIQKLKDDFKNHGEVRIQGSGSLEKYDDLNEWLENIQKIESGLIDNLDPSTFYIILVDEEVAGTICIRHHLTPELEVFGGHVGYAIKPSERRKGYAKGALKLLLELYQNDFSEILIMCEDSNIGSNKVIIDNGGTLIDQFNKFGLTINRYCIKLDKKSEGEK
jgi:predicted acetyltransferase